VAMVAEAIEPDEEVEPDLPEYFMFYGIDVSDGPRFNVTEIAKIFFARSPHWIRLLEREGKFKLDGKRVGTKRERNGARYYNLDDVENIAYALAKQGLIDGNQLEVALMTAWAMAQMWGYDLENFPGSWSYQPFSMSRKRQDRTKIFKRGNGWRWRRVDRTGAVLEESKRSYRSHDQAADAAWRLFGDKPVID
jgi:hypothetical protein